MTTKLAALFLLTILSFPFAVNADSDDAPCGGGKSVLLLGDKACEDTGDDGDGGANAAASVGTVENGIRLDLDEALVSWTLWTSPVMDSAPLLLVRSDGGSAETVLARRGGSIELSRDGEVLVSKIIEQHGGTLEAYLLHEGGSMSIGMWENGEHLYSDKVPGGSHELVALGPVVSISR